MAVNKNWWKKNNFGIPPDDWGTLVKYYSHACYEEIWHDLNEENREKFDKVCNALKLCDWGRYGFSEIEAREKANNK
jgi:hypothetical protein